MHHDRGMAGMAAEAGSRELTSRAANKAEKVTSKWHSTTSCRSSVQIHEPICERQSPSSTEVILQVNRNPINMDGQEA